MSDNYLKELFIDEVKGALNQGGGGSGSGGVSSWNDLTDKPFGEVKTQLIFEVSHGPISENDGKPTYTLFTGDQKFKKTDTLIFEIRDDVFEVNSYFYDGYYNFQIWGTYDVYEQPVENPYPFAFYAGADEYCWDENGYHMSNYTLSFGYREEVYPGLDFDTEVKIYRKDVKPINLEYLPEHLQFGYEDGELTLVFFDDYASPGAGTADWFDCTLSGEPIVELDPNKKYMAIFDGEEYVCNCTTETYSYNSNMGYTFTPENDGPFIINAYADSRSTQFTSLQVRRSYKPEQDTYPFKLYQDNRFIRKLDPKYLLSNVITVTIDWEGDYPTVTGVDKSSDEIYNMIMNGQSLFVRFGDISDTYCEADYMPIVRVWCVKDEDGRIMWECGFEQFDAYGNAISGIWLWNDDGGVSGEYFYEYLGGENLIITYNVNTGSYSSNMPYGYAYEGLSDGAPVTIIIEDQYNQTMLKNVTVQYGSDYGDEIRITADNPFNGSTIDVTFRSDDSISETGPS